MLMLSDKRGGGLGAFVCGLKAKKKNIAQELNDVNNTQILSRLQDLQLCMQSL